MSINLARSRMRSSIGVKPSKSAACAGSNPLFRVFQYGEQRVRKVISISRRAWWVLNQFNLASRGEPRLFRGALTGHNNSGRF